jgi:hypothetical protein
MAGPDLILRVVARLLPREFRERVLEPTIDDLRRTEAERPSSQSRRWLARLAIAAESLRLGLPQLVWRRRRLTKLGVTLVAAVVVVVAVFQTLQYSYAPHR